MQSKKANKKQPEHKKTLSNTLSGDKLYRKLYAHPKMVEDLIQNFVKERFVGHIDFSTLKEHKTRFVTDRDGIRESDMMFELKIKDETVYFYVLLEFQSTVDRFMPVRMLTYIMLFYQDWLKKQIEYKRKLKQKEKKGTLDEADIEAIYETIKLPAVFPILLYNGDRKWTTPSELKELIGVRYEALGKYVPNFRYYKIIENEFSLGSKKEIKSINAAMFRLEQSGAKDVSKYALRLTKILMKEANSELRKDFKLWLNQLIRGYGVKTSMANKIIKNLEVGDVTLLEATIKKNVEKAKTEGRAEGRVEGKAEGRAEGAEKKAIDAAKKMLELGDDVKKISIVTGLPEAKIKTLAKRPTKDAA